MTGTRGTARLAIAATAALLAGCTGSGDGGEAAEPAPPESSPETTVDDDPVDEGGGTDDRDDGATEDQQQPADTGSAESQTLGDPIATSTFDVPGQDGTSVQIDVLSMEPVGDLLRVTMAYTTSWTTEPDGTLNQLLGGLGASTFGPRLVDPVNLLEYRIVEGTHPTESNGIRPAEGAPVVAAYYFALPTEQPQTFDVHIDVASSVGAVPPPLTDVAYQP